MSEVARVIKVLKAFTAKETARLAVNIHRNLKFWNPVDTGFSRARWFMNAGFPPNNDGIEGSGLSSEAKKVLAPGLETKSELTAQVISVGYRLSLGSIYITNHTTYIGELVGGSSLKAPEGTFETAIEVGIQQTIKGTKAILLK